MLLRELVAWAERAGFAVAVIPVAEAALLTDFRRLGFDDAGPLPVFAAPTRPGGLRRALAAAFLPGARRPEGLEVVREPLPAPEIRDLSERLAPAFDLTPAPAPAEPAAAPAEAPGPPAGVVLRREGRPLAFAHWSSAPRGEAAVNDWIAPPDEPDLVAALASETRRAAGARGGSGVRFSTPHRGLGIGLRLARFVTRPSAARVLVRRTGGRDPRVPSTLGWRLTAPTRIETARKGTT